MSRYIALLRGININGKNKISMPQLKSAFTEIGFTDVSTYLNSGNVIFSSDKKDNDALMKNITTMISEKFNLSIPVFIIEQDELNDLLTHAPDWWDNYDKDIYDNLIFIIPPLTYDEFAEKIGNLKEEYEKALPYKNFVFWSFSRKNYQKTNWWSKTATADIKSSITIRTANTVKKICEK